MHQFDWPWRQQHGDSGGGRTCEPAAGFVPAGRWLRIAPPRSGFATTGDLARRHPIGERLLQTGLAVFRSDHAAGTITGGIAESDFGADGPGRVWAGDPLAVPGYAGRGDGLAGSLLPAPSVAQEAPAA